MRLAGAIMVTVAAAAQDRAPYEPGKLIAHLASRAVRESSGLAASRRTPGVYWTHNDSGDQPLIFAFDRNGRDLGAWRLAGAAARDWEGMSAGPGPKRNIPYLYVGDIGDNHRERSEIAIYRLVEPETGAKPGAQTTVRPERLRLRYPDGPHDAEALLVHPRTGDIYIVTKGREGDPESRVYKVAAPHSPGRVLVMRRIATLRLPDESIITLMIGRVTGGDISPDGTRVALCGYLRAWELTLPAQAQFDSIWMQRPRPLSLGERTQGEAVCYRHDGNALLATSEGAPCPLLEALRKR